MKYEDDWLDEVKMKIYEPVYHIKWRFPYGDNTVWVTNIIGYNHYVEWMTKHQDLVIEFEVRRWA